MIKILMVSTFGPNVRGVSPYADSLVNDLQRLEDMEIGRLDYQKAFPSFLLPGGTDYRARNEYAKIHYIKPYTWDVLRENVYDIVHIQYWSPVYLPIILVMIRKIKSHGAKIVLTWHNPSPHESFPLLKLIERKLFKLCDRIVCHTENGKSKLLSVMQGTNINVIPHGCAIHGVEDPAKSDFQQCDLSSEFEYILFFGNIRPYKGLDLLLDAWEMIGEIHTNTKLIVAGRLWSGKGFLSSIVSKLAGTNSNANLIMDRINRHSNQLVCDLGFIPNNKLSSYLKIAKLAVFPYRSFESQSGAAALAAGYGLPIVSTGFGGLRELAIDQSFISPEASVESIACILGERLAAFDVSWKKMQLARAEKMSWPLVAMKHKQVYQEILEFRE